MSPSKYASMAHEALAVLQGFGLEQPGLFASRFWYPWRLRLFFGLLYWGRLQCYAVDASHFHRSYVLRFEDGSHLKVTPKGSTLFTPPAQPAPSLQEACV